MPNIDFVKHRKIWYGISLVSLTAGIVSIVIFGFRFGLDFTGGSLMEINYSSGRPTLEVMQEEFKSQGLEAHIQPSGDSDFLLRLPEIDEQKHQEVLKKLNESAQAQQDKPTITEKRFESFGPSLGEELKRHAIYAVLLVLLAIIVYLSYAFRKVSRPVAAWKFGTVTVIALIHDVLFVVGFFSLLGYLYGTQIDSLFITALLTLLGFSVHDSIVTLDRIRENLFKNRDLTFAQVVNLSTNETISRSINTSLTTLFSMVAIYFFGGPTIKDFSLALIAGIIVGTYSSIFVASPLLVSWHMFSTRRRAS